MAWRIFKTSASATQIADAMANPPDVFAVPGRVRTFVVQLERFPLGLNRDFQGVRKGGALAGDSVSGMRFAAASVSSCDGCPPKWRQILRSCRIYCNMIGIRSS